MASIDIIPVRSRPQMSAFVELPWRLYETDPNWIPPTKSALKRLLNPRKHPFWEFSERELFLAFRGSDVVGRIAAIVDGNHNRHHNERMGVWGFFECEHDPEAAAALFAAAERWLRGKTMVFIRGPLNPSANYEVGLLIQGFDTPPTLMMTYNPAYYAELVHFCGYRKEKDLYAYRIDSDFEPPEWSLEVAERFARKSEISIRRFTAKTLDADLRRMNAIYNECWGRNWGFVPMSEAELKETAREIKRILDPDFAFFLYYGNEPVGICLLLPDANPLLKRLNGRLGISALIKKYRYWSEVTGLRGLLFGVKERYRQTGVPLVAFDHLVRSFRSKEQYRYVELGWNLEDNQAINRLYEEGGARPTKRYRIYQKDLP